MDEKIDIGLARQNLGKRRVAFPVAVLYFIGAEFFNELLKFVYHFDFCGWATLIGFFALATALQNRLINRVYSLLEAWFSNIEAFYH